ncbi:MAG: hypothetical protein PHN69_03090 [Candidatus Pacebacteria bacterium]|nr:hypothetical protein [Candidatus Paceibacterota bacterium]
MKGKMKVVKRLEFGKNECLYEEIEYVPTVRKPKRFRYWVLFWYGMMALHYLMEAITP